MNSLKKNPFKLKVKNNYALVEFIRDELEENKIILVKQNNSTKFRSIYIGKIIDKPKFMYGDRKLKSKIDLSELELRKTIVAYNPMSIQCIIEWRKKIYHIIRIEDVYCIVDKED